MWDIVKERIIRMKKRKKGATDESGLKKKDKEVGVPL